MPGNLYKRNFGTDLDHETNELVIRVQPDEAIYLKINNKVPGLGMRLDRSNLNLLYAARYISRTLSNLFKTVYCIKYVVNYVDVSIITGKKFWLYGYTSNSERICVFFLFFFFIGITGIKSCYTWNFICSYVLLCFC